MILGEGGDIVGVFLFRMLKKEITAERLQMGAVYC